MTLTPADRLVRAFARAAHPLDGGVDELDPILARIGDATCVLIGEGTHGTHEFYAVRAALTRRLIVERGFQAVAIEADWADAERVHRYVNGRASERDAVEALAGFRRFPAWMWRNADVLDFIGWLRSHNDDRAPADRVGFYGLDLYGLHTSIAAVIDHLDRMDPAAAARARERYGCLDGVADDPQRYGYLVRLGLGEGCEDQVVAQLVELARMRAQSAQDGDLTEADDRFAAHENARVVRDAERYYRAMFDGRVSSWNLRDRHMSETFEALATHLGERSGRPAKIVVWAHNSHIGDARASEQGESGELTLGQLVRQAHPDETFLLGQTTHAGTVTAAARWGGPATRMHVRPSLPGSVERLLHDTGLPAFFIDLDALGEAAEDAAHEPRLHRAIGVIYRPATERLSHYFHTRLCAHYDALVHVDETRAVEPLEARAPWDPSEAPETFPSGV